MSNIILQCGSKSFSKVDLPLIMGIVNVTPNSFSDGGLFLNPKRALAHALALIDDGADIIDIGGESTAPGRDPVNKEEECARVIPVIEALIKRGFDAISIDTRKADVAKMALQAGASWINDQMAGFDNTMPLVMSKAERVVIMHSRGKTSGVKAGEEIFYKDLFFEIKQFFNERMTVLNDHGVAKERIIFDPGIGFGKGLRDSFCIINGLNELSDNPILIGLSRKSFLGNLLRIDDPNRRDFATLSAELQAIKNGASIVRTHNVLALKQAIKIQKACEDTSYENLYSARG